MWIFGANYVIRLKLDPYTLRKNYSPKNVVFDNMRFMPIFSEITDKKCIKRSAQLQQVAQLSQRDRAAGRVSYGQKWKTVNGRQYFRTLYSVFNHYDVIGKHSNLIR